MTHRMPHRSGPAPRFSIVTVVRNNAEGLERTRASLRAQTFADYEWVVIDGASTDGTAARVLGLAEEGARVLSEPDTGIYNAMNKGLARAAGGYVILLNAGDRLAAADVLKKVDAALRDRDEPDVLYGGSVMQFPGRRFARPARRPGYIWHGQPGLHQATVFKRRVHVQFPYDEGFRITGDYDVITRMWAAGHGFETCDVTISVNGFDAQSASGRHKMRLIAEAVRCQRRNLKLDWARLCVSVLRRSAVSVLAKALASARGGRA
jgi:putative colanic acid biosynthesis glycosyltransferase